ncbi:MAG: GntP family permease [Bacilli bacterium]|nr:GntP family permease [Bacilli bacterium]
MITLAMNTTAANVIGIIGLVLSLAVLIVLIFKKVPVVFAVPVAAVIAALTNFNSSGANIWPALTNFASGTGLTFTQFLFVFLLSTIYGELVAGLGMAQSISNFFIKLFGKKGAPIVIILTTALLVYGGVSAMVVAFTVAPIGISLLRQTNISKKFLPALIALGQSTFALTALPGSPQVNNIIPTTYLGTTSTAAPVLGIIASVILFGLGTVYLVWQINRSKKKGEGFEEEWVPEQYKNVKEETQTPNIIISFIPMVLLIILFIVFENVKFGSYEFSKQYYGLASVCTAMFVSIIFLVIYGICIAKKKEETLKIISNGAVDWISPLLNFAMIVGFGTVIQNLNGFAVLTQWVIGLGSNYLVAAVTVCLLAGVTGSASGGLKIALNSEDLVTAWTTSDMNMPALHRIISIASGGLDSLPHCGGILADLQVCGETHARSYFHIFIVTVVIPIIATLVLVLLASLGFVY